MSFYICLLDFVMSPPPEKEAVGEDDWPSPVTSYCFRGFAISSLKKEA